MRWLTLAAVILTCAPLPTLAGDSLKSIEAMDGRGAEMAASKLLADFKARRDWKPTVHGLLKSKHDGVRNHALRSLAESFWDKSLIPVIRKILLHDAEEANRIMAAQLLREKKVVSAKADLKKVALEDSSESVRDTASFALKALETLDKK